MTKVRLLALLAVVALVLLPALAVAQEPPQLPCGFYGTVKVSGADVADGTVITATIDGDTYTATTTNSVYSIIIAQPEGKAYEGKTVTFKISDDLADQTATWTMGGNVAVSLSIGVPVTPGTGGISRVEVTGLPAGSTPTVEWNPTTGVLKLGIPAGATGPAGPKGDTGAQGPAGKGASTALGIVAIILAAIAIVGVGVMLMRKPKAAPPA
jgi:hypothetical protein